MKTAHSENVLVLYWVHVKGISNFSRVDKACSLKSRLISLMLVKRFYSRRLNCQVDRAFRHDEFYVLGEDIAYYKQ